MSLARALHAAEYIAAGTLSQFVDKLDSPLSRKGRLSAQAISSVAIPNISLPDKVSAKVICSLWRSNVLLKYAHSVDRDELWDFLQHSVTTPDGDIFDVAAPLPGAIIATPHYGPFLPLCLDLIRRFDGKRKLNIMFNDPVKTPSNRSHEDLF